MPFMLSNTADLNRAVSSGPFPFAISPAIVRQSIQLAAAGKSRKDHVSASITRLQVLLPRRPSHPPFLQNQEVLCCFLPTFQTILLAFIVRSQMDSMLAVVKSHLTSDFRAAELKWFWFRAALFSYKRNFLLRPFPPAFRKNDSRLESASSLSAIDDDESKDFEKLASVAASIPTLSCLGKGDDDGLKEMSQDQLRLLVWVLDTDKYFRLGTEERQLYDQIKKLTGQQHTAKVPEPDFIFRVDYDEESEAKFQKRRGDRKTVFAYHGSRLTNFYSIIRNGLRSSLNQVSAFGEGTYLSPELSVSLNWSPMSGINVASAKNGTSSDPSSFEGTRLSCVAVCEVIDDPTGGGVSRCECAFDANSSNMDTRNSGGRRNANGVPDRYILVKNDDLLRIRYVLAYVDRSSVKIVKERGRTIGDRIGEFCSQHRFWLIMLAYLLLLTAVGVLNSNSFQWYVRRLWSSATSEYGYFDNEYPGENFHHSYEDT